jgi:glutamate formiminotransferase
MRIECVPNFSEGRDAQVIDALVAACDVTGAAVLDVHSDFDHHRTVITVAGEPDAVQRAVMQAAGIAIERIDLRTHDGVHPRIGAVDVVPFVPLHDATMHDCTEIARAFGRALADAYQVPVYLYEAAATQPQRRNLADVRRGGYEGLRQRVKEAAWVPDFGPAHLGPAGACAVGARPVLIAFNVYLTTDDAGIARQIARAIRESGGGLPAVKALGLHVKGRAQVSMNLVDHRRTSLYEVMQRLRALCDAHGVGIAESELVGLVPQAALIDYARASLGLPSETATRTIEAQLGRAFADWRGVS